jgi:hypothetical protein
MKPKFFKYDVIDEEHPRYYKVIREENNKYILQPIFPDLGVEQESETIKMYINLMSSSRNFIYKTCWDHNDLPRGRAGLGGTVQEVDADEMLIKLLK